MCDLIDRSFADALEAVQSSRAHSHSAATPSGCSAASTTKTIP
jgi:hypothetical protein